MSEQDHETVDRELGVLLRRARSMSLTFASRVHPGLELGAYATLFLLDEAGPLRGSEVGERFRLDKSTVSRQLSRLIELGLAERTPDPTDGRAQLVTITASGHERLMAVREDRRREFRHYLESWNERDVGEFGRLLARFNETAV